MIIEEGWTADQNHALIKCSTTQPLSYPVCLIIYYQNTKSSNTLLTVHIVIVINYSDDGCILLFNVSISELTWDAESAHSCYILVLPSPSSMWMTRW